MCVLNDNYISGRPRPTAKMENDIMRLKVAEQGMIHKLLIKSLSCDFLVLKISGMNIVETKEKGWLLQQINLRGSAWNSNINRICEQRMLR